MEIDEKILKDLIIRAIELFQSENSRQNISFPKKKVYVIFTEEFNEKYLNFFKNLNKKSEYDAYAVVTPEIYNNSLVNNLKEFQVCKSIIDINDINFDKLSNYLTVFPTISRTAIVKTALCIEDTFETKWIFKSIEKGEKIILLRSGLERFSGKEPLSYVNKILDYYRTLLEFNIDIAEDIFTTENKESLITNEIEDETSNYYESSGKKIITENQVEMYRYNKKIILKTGDIITDMAIDKARNLNIEIIRRNI